MSFGLLRQLFRQIRILDTQCPHLAQTTRKSVRHHVDQYHTVLQNFPKKIKIRQQYQTDLLAFVNFLSQVNNQSSKFSLNQKMKLVDIVCNRNKYVDSKFQLRKEVTSKQMSSLFENRQFRQLRQQGQKKFVIEIVKKLFQGQETFEYPHLSDYLQFKRFKKQIQGQQQLQKLDKQCQTRVIRILKGDQYVNHNYRKIYQYYFSGRTKEEVSFQNYLDSLYIMIDFDDLGIDWATNTKEIQKNFEINSSRISKENELKNKNKQSKRAFLQQVQKQKNYRSRKDKPKETQKQPKTSKNDINLKHKN